MSPAETLPPRMWIVIRIWRRAGCASAAITESSASRRSSAGLLGRDGIDDGDLEALEDRRHRLPDRHDLGRLVGEVRRLLVAPREDLDEVVLVGADVVRPEHLRHAAGDEAGRLE